MLHLGRVARRQAGRPLSPPSSGGDTAALSLIIPVHDAPAVVRRCLASVARHRGQAEVILVDDGSELPETRRLLTDFAAGAGAKLIRHETPQSHSRACESGAAVANGDILGLLNSDTILTAGCLEAILKVFDAPGAPAVAGPMTSYAATPQALIDVMPFRHEWDEPTIEAFAHLYTRRFGRDYLNPLLAPARFDVREVSGFAFFIRRDVWREMEGFDKKLPDYGNESELCARLVKLGRRLVVTRGSYIHHLGRQSFGPRSNP